MCPPPARLGSGVLPEVLEATHLLTAAHVLLEVAEELSLGIGGATHIVRAGGEARYSRANPAAVQLTELHEELQILFPSEHAESLAVAAGPPVIILVLARPNPALPGGSHRTR